MDIWNAKVYYQPPLFKQLKPKHKCTANEGVVTWNRASNESLKQFFCNIVLSINSTQEIA